MEPRSPLHQGSNARADSWLNRNAGVGWGAAGFMQTVLGSGLGAWRQSESQLRQARRSPTPLGQGFKGPAGAQPPLSTSFPYPLPPTPAGAPTPQLLSNKRVPGLGRENEGLSCHAAGLG